MLDPLVILSGAFVGFVVGLTGMGGGALMTPILVLLFGIEPLTAVSSDVVASMIMKPVGGAVHWRRGTVEKDLVKWLVLGSVPTAFFGVLLLSRLNAGGALQSYIRLALGAALLLVTAGLVLRPVFTARKREGEETCVPVPLVVKRARTLLIGVVGGAVVGFTSVGSGSLIIIMLLLLYPRLPLCQLVGTDLVQAVPLVTSAAVAHLFFGSFKLDLASSILIGAIPGVFVGARFSSRAADYVIRPALVVVLLVTGLKLLGASNTALGVIAAIAVAGGLAYGIRMAQRARLAAAAAAAASSLTAAIAPDASVYPPAE